MLFNVPVHNFSVLSARIQRFLCTIMKICLYMEHTEIFSAVKIENFIRKIDIFNNFTENMDCGYTLELPCSGGMSTPNLSFGLKIRKIGICL